MLPIVPKAAKNKILVALVNEENMTLQADGIVHMIDDMTKVEVSKTEIVGSEGTEDYKKRHQYGN